MTEFISSVFVRAQIRIMLRLGIQISNLPRTISTRKVFPKELIATLSITYFKMIKINFDVFVNDPVLLTEWYRFTLKHPAHVINVIKS